MPKLSPEALRLVRNAAEAERACGSAKLATALEMLIEWHERQDERKTVTIVEPIASRAVLDVIAERIRQVVGKGYTAAHDDHHVAGEMVGAAAAYAAYRSQASLRDLIGNDVIATLWPWRSASWKPSTPRRDLVKAAALTLAEIERIDRAAAANLTTTETGGTPT